MTRDEAITRLTSMLAGEPTLSSGEISDLLDDYTREDDDGNDVYSLHESAESGWRLKAVKVSGDYHVSFDGQSLHREQVFAHCIEMANYHAGRVPIRPAELKRTDVKG